jgi:hypothetical protein
VTNTTNKPAKTVRIGNVSASIWKRTAKDGSSTYYTVQLQRSYRTDEGPQYTDSFNHDDLLNVAELARRAERWIADNS